jgi:hypothetical protein
VTVSTFKIGDYLTVRGSPHIDPTHHELALLKEIRRQRMDGTGSSSGIITAQANANALDATS